MQSASKRKRFFPLFIFLFILLASLHPIYTLPKAPTKVVIAGATSGVGNIVFRKLLERPGFYPVGLVRDKRGYEILKKIRPEKIHKDQIQICDITVKESLEGIFDSAKKVVICTSATPLPKLSYKVKSLFRWIIGKERPPRPQELYYPKQERPYEVDYIGQINVIEQAVKAGVEHIVLLGSMGGTIENNKKNLIGINPKASDPKDGNILYWKREVEKFLMRRCPYTIIHAGQLTNEKGGDRRILQDTDDQLLLSSPYNTISREDCAEVIVQALLYQEAILRSIDVVAGPEKGKTDWIEFWLQKGNCSY